MHSTFLSDDSSREVDPEMCDRHGTEVDGVGLKLSLVGADLMLFPRWCIGNRN